jgi:hypothetical protein
MSDREKLGLRGKVKTVTEFVLLTQADQKQEKPTQTASYEFDEQGRTVLAGGNTGSTEWISVSTYDGEGRIVKCTSSSAGAVYHETNYAYGPDGRLLQYVSGGAQGRIEANCTYDEQGQKTVVHIFDQAALDRTRQSGFSGSPWAGAASGYGVPDGGRVRMRFDEREQPVEAEVLSVDGQIIQRILRKYDAAGRLAEEKQVVENPEYMVPGGVRAQMLSQSGATLEGIRQRLSKFFGGAEGLTCISYSYDGQGRAVQRRTRRAPFFEEIKTTKYNDRGDGLEERMITSGAHGAKMDEQGNVVPSVSPAPEPQEVTVRYSYKYDDHGNWTEQAITHEGTGGQSRPGAIRKRTIAYY